MKSRIILSISICATLFLTGCMSDVLIERSSKSKRPYYGQSYNVKELNSSAINLLANLMLRAEYEKDPSSVVRKLEEMYRQAPNPEILVALASLSWNAGINMAKSDESFAASAYSSALLYTYHYLTHSDDPNKNPYNTDRFVMMNLYNQAQTELFAYLKKRDLLLKDNYQLLTLSGKELVFAQPEFLLPDKDIDPNNLYICADYRTKDLFHKSYRFGLGTPLVLAIKDQVEDSVHSGKSLPITLVTKISRDKSGKYLATMNYINVLQSEEVSLGKQDKYTFPLELDFSTPLAFLTQHKPLYNFLDYTFHPGATSDMQGLYFLQPYDPNRIPVLFVHGLLSNPRTWVQMINTLQNDPVIRKHYQFWGYSYSSGNPILLSAQDFRNSLDSTVERLKAAGIATKQLDRMVVVGHSMGGLLSKTLIMDSGKEILKKSFDISWDNVEGKLTEEQRKRIKNLLIFKPKDYVKRVVFIAVPHRGASLATSLVGKIGSHLITIPINIVQETMTIKQELVNLISSENNIHVDIKLTNNGIIDLQPNNRVLNFLNAGKFSPSIPYHSIIGNNKEANEPSGTDGIVPYISSHLDGVQSELVVESGHSAHRQPLAIMEIRRILLEHLQGYEDTRQEDIKEEFLSK